MAGKVKPYDDRELARRVVEKDNRSRAIPGTRGQRQRLTERELEYLRWLYAKTAAEQSGS
jgi:hypothetical protein